jgi:uncharacterized membrane protein YkoI
MSYDEKAVVKIDSDGNVTKCAKGLGSSECGFEAGAKVCGKCGAMPVQIKGSPLEEEFRGNVTNGMPEGSYEYDPEEKPLKKKKKIVVAGPDFAQGAEGQAMDESDMADEEDDSTSDEDGDAGEGGIVKPRRPAAGEQELEKGWGMARRALRMKEGEEEMPEEDDAEEEGMMPTSDMEKMRKRRLASMGMDLAAVGKTAYLCGIDRKVYPGGSSVCDDCPGGCMAEKGMPGLLHVEGIAEDMFDGKVIDSGYSSDADMFVVDVQVKDGRAVEMFVDGTTAEVLGWHKLDSDSFEQKSAFENMMVIDMSEAAEIAVKSIEGNVVAVEPDVFEGFDTYAVEIEGINGKSYDVFVSLDGEVMGYDVYEPEEAEDIEAEAAEIALKRAFSEDMRNAMAKEGTALPDGSFPIATKADLENAIQAYGRASDKKAAKLHIMKRARALGAESLIPTSWVAGGQDGESKSLESDDFIASLLEFELLAAEVDEQE